MFFVLELTEMIIMDKINDSEIKNAPPQNGNIANSNKLQNIREIHPIIKNLWFISILNFKLIFINILNNMDCSPKLFVFLFLDFQFVCLLVQ